MPSRERRFGAAAHSRRAGRGRRQEGPDRGRRKGGGSGGAQLSGTGSARTIRIPVPAAGCQAAASAGRGSAAALGGAAGGPGEGVPGEGRKAGEGPGAEGSGRATAFKSGLGGASPWGAPGQPYGSASARVRTRAKTRPTCKSRCLPVGSARKRRPANGAARRGGSPEAGASAGRAAAGRGGVFVPGGGQPGGPHAEAGVAASEPLTARIRNWSGVSGMPGVLRLPDGRDREGRGPGSRRSGGGRC